jgi:hypothetical protein
MVETLTFSKAFKYPFKTTRRLLYAFLLLIPIFGWLVLIGYIIRLINEFIEGRYEGLIKLDIMEDLKLGIIIFVKSLPFYIVYAIVLSVVNYVSPTLKIPVSLLLKFFIIPILSVNFYRKQTIRSYFEFDVLNVIKDNLGDYIMIILKQYALIILFSILSIVLIGIPALLFTSSIFFANFYGNLIERKTALTS